MRRLRFLLLSPLLLAVALPASADGGPEQAAVAVRAPSQGRMQRQLRTRHAEVARLQRQVTTQESHSREAGERLAEQDREIARLRRQLEALAPAHDPHEDVGEP